MKSMVLYLAILFSQPLWASQWTLFENKLLPFQSDGCSAFLDSVGQKSWQHCCLNHDLAYWKGGTFEEKVAADSELKMCVADSTHSVLGSVMKKGVRFGGHPSLPTSWKWGYGWVVNRGYKALSDDQLALAQSMLEFDFEKLQLQNTDYNPKRATITGDYCVDEALERIQISEGEGPLLFNLKNDESSNGAEGTIRRMIIETSVCPRGYKAEFLLLKADVCSKPTSELLARGRIRLQSFQSHCLAP